MNSKIQNFRISQAAALLGVSDDSVRRLVDASKLSSHSDVTGRQVIMAPSLPPTPTPSRWLGADLSPVTG